LKLCLFWINGFLITTFSRFFPNYFHFAYLSATQMNHVENMSVSYCSNTTSLYYSIWIIFGDQGVDNTNSSMNHAYQVSCTGVSSPSSFTNSHCLSQTIRYLMVLVYASILPQEQYQCHLPKLFIRTVHLMEL